MPAREFVAAIDDSGGHAALLNPDGTPIESPSQPFIGIGAITLSRDQLPTFEQSWNNLRNRIADTLKLPTPPPIHLRWMWGNHRPDKHKNPYLHASNEQVRSWLREAVQLLLRYQSRYRNQFGMYAEFYLRKDFQDGFSPYYHDPGFHVEHAFLQSKHIPKGLYARYHRISSYPLVRTLPSVLWELSASVKIVGGHHLDIVLDAFTEADGVSAENFVRTAQTVAGITHLRSIQVVDSYSESPLVQAADLVAWVNNRARTKQLRKEPDRPFLDVFGALLTQARKLSGSLLTASKHIPGEASWQTLCVAYTLARNAIHQTHPGFVDDVFVSIEEFHARALNALSKGQPGVSVLTTEGMKQAQAHAEAQMTGPRSETAAE